MTLWLVATVRNTDISCRGKCQTDKPVSTEKGGDTCR